MPIWTLHFIDFISCLPKLNVFSLVMQGICSVSLQCSSVHNSHRIIFIGKRQCTSWVPLIIEPDLKIRSKSFIRKPSEVSTTVCWTIKTVLGPCYISISTPQLRSFNLFGSVVIYLQSTCCKKLLDYRHTIFESWRFVIVEWI